MMSNSLGVCFISANITNRIDISTKYAWVKMKSRPYGTLASHFNSH